MEHYCFLASRKCSILECCIRFCSRTHIYSLTLSFTEHTVLAGSRTQWQHAGAQCLSVVRGWREGGRRDRRQDSNWLLYVSVTLPVSMVRHSVTETAVACPSSRCHLFRWNTTTLADTSRYPVNPTPLKMSNHSDCWEEATERGAPRANQSVIQKLTFPSSSSALRSNDRCSWTAELVEPWVGGWVVPQGEMMKKREKNIKIYYHYTYILYFS